MGVAIDSPCRSREAVRFIYAGIDFIRSLDDAGKLSVAIDCIMGDAFPVDVLFADDSRYSLKVTALDLDRITKVALLWRAPVNLDLHAFEYAARLDQPGHVWAGAPSSPGAALEQTTQTARGHGFMSSLSTGQKDGGTQMEVYTFWRHANQKSGVVSLALDYETRSRSPPDTDTCGNGLYSEISYETIVLDRNKVKRQLASLAPIDCGVQLTGPARYNTRTIPEITTRP